MSTKKAAKKPVAKKPQAKKPVAVKSGASKSAAQKALPSKRAATTQKPKASAAKPVKATGKPSVKASAKPVASKNKVKTSPVNPKPTTSRPLKPTEKAGSKPASKTPAKAPVKTPSLKPTKSTPSQKAHTKEVAAAVSAAKAAKPIKAAADLLAATPPQSTAPTPPAPARGKSGKSKAVVTSNPDIEMPTYQFTPVAPPPVMPTPAKRKFDPKLSGAWKSKSADQLTDQEVLAMPDSEYMNDKQLAFFRHKLVTLKNDLLSNADETTEHLREDTVIVPDPADRATIEEEHALELRTRDRERKLLKKIEQAIARIDANDYGYCDETGEEIGVARLIARPTATLSLEAQQRREMKQKMFGD